MKQIISPMLIAMVLFSASNATAQQGFSYSVKAVPQFSFLFNKTDYDNSQHEYKATFNAAFGVGANYNFTANTGLGVDVLYSLQGQKYKVNGVEFEQKIDYVKIPLLFNYTFFADKPVAFFGKIGPQVSLRSSSALNDGNGKALIDNTNDQYKSATFGGVALAGTQFKLNKKLFLTTALRYDVDFTNAENTSYADYPAGRHKTYNSTAGVEVGLKMLLK